MLRFPKFWAHFKESGLRDFQNVNIYTSSKYRPNQIIVLFIFTAQKDMFVLCKYSEHTLNKTWKEFGGKKLRETQKQHIIFYGFIEKDMKVLQRYF